MSKYIDNAYGYIKGAFKRTISKVYSKSFSIGKSLRLFKGSKLSLYQKALGSIGNNVKVDENSVVVCTGGAHLIIGDNVGIGPQNRIICRNDISIGEGTLFGPNVFVYDHDHVFDIENGVRRSEFTCGDVIIGRNCWIGANTVILKGTNIGDNCVIGAGCVIKGTYANGSRIIQKRKTVMMNDASM